MSKLGKGIIPLFQRYFNKFRVNLGRKKNHQVPGRDCKVDASIFSLSMQLLLLLLTYDCKIYDLSLCADVTGRVQLTGT
jgi:hypothetical protein